MAESIVANSKRRSQDVGTPRIKTHTIESLRKKKFGRLQVLEEVEPYILPSGVPRRQVLCRCDCGTELVVRLPNLTGGCRTQSCGCLVHDRMIRQNTIHGLHNHPLNRVWRGIKRRCLSPTGKEIETYTGVTICKEWSDDFKAFYDWAILNGWHEDLVIDRENNQEGYSPDNCRFVDRGLSNRNTKLIHKHNTSGYRGVSFVKDTGKWIAQIMSDKKRYRLGQYINSIDAAKAYDAKARELNAGHPLNFPDAEIDRE